jgi:peroxiredoxin (alkyl hydroperoxide reductase subunit C)
MMKCLIGQQCPDFSAPALMPDGGIRHDFHFTAHSAGRTAILFFYPMNFGLIALSELRALQDRLDKFTARDTCVVAVSGDSPLAHGAWQSQPTAQGGLGPVGFPMVADMTRGVARQFDILVADAMAEAATMLVDKTGKVVYQLRHDTAIGRNIDRMIAAVDSCAGPLDPKSSPAMQILQAESHAARLRAAGYTIVAQSIDLPLSDPEWTQLPRDKQGKIDLSFPFLDGRHEWPRHDGLTIALREGRELHSTGLLLPDGQLLFECHAERRIPRDFEEMVRIAGAIQKHKDNGKLVVWPEKEPG